MEKKEFKPFERILTRMEGAKMWQASIFSHYEKTETGAEYLVCIADCMLLSKVEAIPYEGNEELLGTCNDPAVARVEPKVQYRPENGDIVRYKSSLKEYFAIYRKRGNPYAILTTSGEVVSYGSDALIDEGDFSVQPVALLGETIKLIFDSLKKAGLGWNEDKTEIVKLPMSYYLPVDGSFIAFGNKKECPIIGIFKEGTKDNEEGDYYDEHEDYCDLDNGRICLPDLEENVNLCDGWVCDNMRPATEEEKERLINALHDAGKDWDAEKKEVVEYKWKPKQGETCYGVVFQTLTNSFAFIETAYYGRDAEKTLYAIGRLFRTKREAIDHRTKLNNAIKEVEK